MGRPEKAAAYSTALLVVSVLIAFVGWGGDGVMFMAVSLMVAIIVSAVIVLVFSVFYLFYEEFLK